MRFNFPAAAQNPLPSGGLQYPEKDTLSQIFQVKSLDKQETWYPTLQKTLWVLSQLHDFVKVRAFLSLLSCFSQPCAARNLRGHRAGSHQYL